MSAIINRQAQKSKISAIIKRQAHKRRFSATRQDGSYFKETGSQKQISGKLEEMSAILKR
jgi:hypothetical protein